MYAHVTKDKKVLPWRFKKVDGGYEASLDNKIKLGQVLKLYNYWCAVSYIYPKRGVNGFSSRANAMQYLISLYTEKEEVQCE